ncbi:site-specific integrase [Haloarcula rubripromontorii]|uniref:site-specific integrase n=1 Tax=Haloarcula rubripromontorii TaxID=1705562 RepID=UPI00345C50D8
MRLEATNSENRTKVWMTDEEIEDLRRAAASYRDDIIIQLGAYVGLRAFEVPQVQPQHVKETENGQYRLRVPEGKDTTGNGGKPRDAFLPPDVERSLQQFATAENIAPRDSFVELTERGVRAAVKRTAEAAADQTGDDDFQHVSSHDLRRRFAQRLLVDRELNPRVVMQVGGWDSFQAIEPYLNAPTEDVVDEAFQEAGLV